MVAKFVADWRSKGPLETIRFPRKNRSQARSDSRDPRRRPDYDRAAGATGAHHDPMSRRLRPTEHRACISLGNEGRERRADA